MVKVVSIFLREKYNRKAWSGLLYSPKSNYKKELEFEFTFVCLQIPYFLLPCMLPLWGKSNLKGRNV